MREPHRGSDTGAVSSQLGASELKATLKRSFGFSDFRPHQETIIRAALEGRDVFAALPTGGGKSLCYQLPALLRPGLTVVVSPLIALMKDQVDAARENGIAASYLNSSLEPEQAHEVRSALAAGRVTLLYVSPERLAIAEFREALVRYKVAAFAVDEAHCVSEWGHEFRPDYRNLSALRAEFPTVPIAAFTATATKEVQADIISQLALRRPLIVRASFNRPEITYRVEPKHKGADQIAAFVAERPGEPGIVYRSTRKATEDTAARLCRDGVRAAAYHAGLPDERRAEVQEEFVRDDLQVVVATIAFGMGIDKSNVRWILHGDLPRSLEAYYQETGRAGRDGEPAGALLLWSPQDIAIIRRHISNIVSDTERAAAEKRLTEVLRYADAGVCRRKLLLAHFNETLENDCNGCDFCLGEVRTEDCTIAAQKLLSAAVRTGEVFGAHHLVDIVTGTASDRVTERRHEQLPTFGVGREQNRTWWLALAQDLESTGLLARRGADQGRRGGFYVTERGRKLLRGAERFESLKRASHRTPVETTTPTLLRPDQEALFQSLRTLRKRIAVERGVPPYVVFSDKTLKAMAANRPTSAPALLRCHGVGERKLEAYGERFLETVRRFLHEGNTHGASRIQDHI